MEDTTQMRVAGQTFDNDYQDYYTDLHEMGWFIRGPIDSMKNGHYKKWIQWRQIETDISGRITTFLINALHDYPIESFEMKYLTLFKFYWASKLDGLIAPETQNIGDDIPDFIYPD